MKTPELKPTGAQITDACMWYRHDFGLLGVAEQSKVKYQALEWLLAWQKAIPALGDTQAAIAAAMMRAIDELLAFRGPVDVPRTDKAIIQDDAINRCIEILNDHIPPDAMAALEAVKAQARVEALEKAAQFFDSLDAMDNAKVAAAAIRAMKYDQIGVRYPWEGGECPVDGNSIVRVWYSDDPNKPWKNANPARTWYWKNDKSFIRNIIAFEIVEFAK